MPPTMHSSSGCGAKNRALWAFGGMAGRGAGSKLYTELFRSLENEDVHRAYAGVSLPNPASIALHERFGFKRVAHFTEQGRKFGRYWDVAWYEKPLGAPDARSKSPGNLSAIPEVGS